MAGRRRGRGPSGAAHRRSATGPLGRTSRVRDLDRLTGWLIAFHHQTQQGTIVITDDGFGEGFLDPLVLISSRSQVPSALAPLDDALRRHRGEVLGLSVPLVERHHDLVPANVLRSGRTISVVDWAIADGTTVGPALRDLLLFVTFWHGLVHRAAGVDDDVRWTGALLAGEGDRYHRAA